MEGGFQISLALWPLLALSIAYFDHPHKGHIWLLAQASFPLQALQDVASTVWKHQENIRIWVELFHCTDYRIMTKLLCRWWWWWYEYAAYQTMFISYTAVLSLILGWNNCMMSHCLAWKKCLLGRTAWEPWFHQSHLPPSLMQLTQLQLCVLATMNLHSNGWTVVSPPTSHDMYCFLRWPV